MFNNALTAVGALMTLLDFTLPDARRFYSSMGSPSAVKGIKDLLHGIRNIIYKYGKRTSQLKFERNLKIFPQETMAAGENRFAPDLN